MSYEQRLLDQWQRLTQGNKTVTEYIAKFDEFIMRCNVVESEAATLSRFRAGLYEEINRELFLREVHDLDQAYQVARDCERFQRRPLFRRPEPPRINPPGNRPSPSPSIANRPSPTTPLVRREDKGKSPEVRREGNVHCFRCHKIGHYASQCPTRALHIGEKEEEDIEPIEHSEEEEVYEAGVSLADEYEGDEEIIDSSETLGVVRCILTQTKEQEDWRRSNILQTFIKIGEKVCKVILDSGSCVNAISTATVKNLGLPTVPHPNPYKVSWIDSTSIPIKSRCQVMIQFQSYQEKIWCDVLPMGVSSIILGRPWLYDHDAILYGRSNSCSFIHNGKKIVINSSPPKDQIKRGSSQLRDKKQGLNMISAKELEQELAMVHPSGY